MTEYRKIDLTGMQPISPASQPAPQLAWIEIADLVVDERYQRPLAAGNRAAIRRIASEFLWSRFGPVLVAPVEGGKYALIDGQHRAHAAALCGFERIPAMVALVAPEEQALAFIEINTRQIKVSSFIIYRAALSAGEAWAVECHDRVKAAGCQLMTAKWSQSNKKPGMVFSVELIRNLVDAGKGEAVTAGLTALLQFDQTSVPNFSNMVLKPFLSAVAECGGSVDDWLRVLQTKRPFLVIELADRFAEAEGVQRASARKQAFCTLYREVIGS